MDQLVEGRLTDHEVEVTFAEVVSRINPLLASKEELPRCIRTPKLWVVVQNMPRVLSWAPGQWETMLFTQPPIKKLELKCFAYRGVGCVVKQYMMENPQGVRLGEMMKRIRQMQEELDAESAAPGYTLHGDLEVDACFTWGGDIFLEGMRLAVHPTVKD